MEIMILSADTVDGARVQIEAALNKIASILGPPSWDPNKRGFSSNGTASFAVVIDGDPIGGIQRGVDGDEGGAVTSAYKRNLHQFGGGVRG